MVFVPGRNNSDDQFTGYNPLDSLVPHSLWIKGPQFLFKN